VQVANLNAPGQVVLSGHRAAIASAEKLALAAGARRVLPLSVGGPFHSAYMAKAATDFARAAEEVVFQEPRVPIVLNTTALTTKSPAALKDELSLQVISPVRWEESLHALADLGCGTFVELGPGQVLSGLVRRTLPDATVMAAGTPEAVAKVSETLRAMSDE
jgi:[acyl-carrier-protein] S-malonyltransferase